MLNDEGGAVAADVVIGEAPGVRNAEFRMGNLRARSLDSGVD